MSDHNPERADVLIVGAGPAGSIAARRLARAGYSVVCLEQGDWPDYSKVRASEADFELTSAKEWSWNPNVRQAPSDYPINDTESSITPIMGNGVGGSALYYAAQWMRNKPSDFRVRTLDGVADDWPMTYEDVVPYYEEIEKDFAVSGVSGDPSYPGFLEVPLPPAPLGKIGRRMAEAHNKLGWHWWPGSNAIATRRHGALGACTQRGTCMWGCPEKAKASPDLTIWPDAIEAGARLVTGARVRSIETDAAGLATGALYIDREGREIFQGADVVILAANGVGTPRILLNSASAQHPGGLANSTDLVGRRLMMHPVAVVVGLFEEELDSWQGVYGHAIYSHEFYETDATRGFVRGAKWGLFPTGGPLGATRSWPWGNADIWGEPFHREIDKRFGHSMTWGILSEDLPVESNRVMLDPVLKDADGIPAPKLIYETSDNSRKLLDFHIARAKESFEAAGAYDTVVAPQVRETGWHLLGTAKMGIDRATSVVNEWGRTHDVPNLYIFDGSIWPTSAGMNPTSTVAALSAWFSDRIISQRGSQEVPV